MRDALDHGFTHIQDAATYPNYVDFFARRASSAFRLALSLTTDKEMIPDRANNAAPNAFESGSRGLEQAYRQPRIEHAQSLTQEDIQRFSKLGGDCQYATYPCHTGRRLRKIALSFERVKGAYAWRTLFDSSAKLARGSDFPVEGINPLLGVYAAVSRLRPDGTSPHEPQACYVARLAFLFFTNLEVIAYVAFQEKELGSIKVGKRVDLVLLDRDIIKVPQGEILMTKVNAAIIDGKITYGWM
ncbi:hypothetical protein DACRYDRAFT_117391 [Dacryopinax primogenitus]|uniref:Amidohydrolase 3 domain-containing protein n=1 Tax=Dacryopinax primogenitus (strain DJM 731) TaxID=1858805 RepID=M5G3H7_DACPD|nr:uncharacterized protein DACRYDRAFT_117391 [Dacryopinax primogenitus]EJU00422.1 hypothetical protein DACRYDRAFT_117391 [Dacryopinax primogenitus]